MEACNARSCLCLLLLNAPPDVKVDVVFVMKNPKACKNFVINFYNNWDSVKLLNLHIATTDLCLAENFTKILKEF